MKRIILAVATVLINLGIGLSQTHFTVVYPGYGTEQMNFYAWTGSNIDGTALQTGDEVAVFDGTYCVGVAVFEGTWPLSVPASKDDPVTPGVTDGYIIGHTATFKMWDASAGVEITDIELTMVGGSLTFDPGTSAFVILAGTSPAQTNTAPVVSSIGNRSVGEGNPFSGISLDGYVTDAETPDENIIWTFSGNTDLSITVTDRIAWITPIDENWNGSETITFTATDDDPVNPLFDSESAVFTVTAVNDAPVITGQMVLSVNEDNDLVLTPANFTITDVDNPTGPFTLTVNTGANYTRTGTTIRPSLNYNGTLTVPVTVSDGSASSDVYGATVAVNPVNDYPNFVSTPGVVTINVGDAYSFTFTAADVDGDPITWSAENLPGWLSFNTETHVVSGTPQSGDAGDYTYTIYLDDGHDPVHSFFLIHVLDVNSAPEVSGIPNQSTPEGSNFSTIVLDDYVTDDHTPDAAISWSYSGNSNLSVSIVDRVATITNTNPDWNGSETITFTATDDDATPLSGSDNAIFTVSPVNDAPVFTSTPITSASSGSLYSYTVAASDVDLDNLTFEAVVLPAWLTFDPATKILSGTPDNSHVGNAYNVTIRVTDGLIPVNQEFVITVSGSNNNLAFTSATQTIFTTFPSSTITLEVQNPSGDPVNVDSDVTIQLSTTSATGTFSMNKESWASITTVIIPAGSHAVSFYYKDNTVGTPTVTASESPDMGWTDATQQFNVELSSLSHTIHSVGGSVRTSLNTVPLNGEMTFSAYITSRPTEILTQSSAGCAYSGGYWWVQCSTLPTGWAAGETMNISFTDAGSGEVGFISITLSNNPSDNAGLVTLSALQSPVITGVLPINGNDLQLTWEQLLGSITYKVYRDTVAFFSPDKINGTNRIASNIIDQEPGTLGVQWTDLDIVGNASKNYFYIVTANVGAFESGNSSTVGKFDFTLITTPSTDFNEIALPLNFSNVTNASELLSIVPGCNSVGRWNAATQGYDQYISFIPPSNFSIEMGYPYYVNVTYDAVFTLTGEIVEPTFNLITTPSTDFNEVMLTLDKTEIKTASELMADIPNCNSIAKWNASTQGSDQYLSFIPPSNFGVRVGYPYYVNVSENTIWPMVSGGKKNALFADNHNMKECAPHLIWGKLVINDHGIIESEISYSAHKIGKPEESINNQSAGCFIKEGYWIVQCHSFASGWKAGDIIKVVFSNKSGLQLDEVEVVLTNEPADAGKDIIIDETSAGYLLSQNTPNPFTDYTIIHYQIPQDGFVEIEVYGITGEKHRTLVNDYKPAGSYEVMWNGQDNHGNTLSKGMYIYILKSNKTLLMKKSVLMR
ncbi:MAG: putative Ig domain-containing protein [Bacteroidales bacterium]|nr:putative Ig domain-containing protein [Bacteroidales bacterium]